MTYTFEVKKIHIHSQNHRLLIRTLRVIVVVKKWGIESGQEDSSMLETRHVKSTCHMNNEP